MDTFSFPATLTPDEDGGFVITFRDIPEAITQGETLENSLSEASDCLEEAIAAYIDDERDIFRFRPSLVEGKSLFVYHYRWP